MGKIFFQLGKDDREYYYKYPVRAQNVSRIYLTLVLHWKPNKMQINKTVHPQKSALL